MSDELPTPAKGILETYMEILKQRDNVKDMEKYYAAMKTACEVDPVSISPLPNAMPGVYESPVGIAPYLDTLKTSTVLPPSATPAQSPQITLQTQVDPEGITIYVNVRDAVTGASSGWSDRIQRQAILEMLGVDGLLTLMKSYKEELDTLRAEITTLREQQEIGFQLARAEHKQAITSDDGAW